MARNLVTGEYIGGDRLIHLRSSLPNAGDCGPDLVHSGDSIYTARRHLESGAPELYGLWNGKEWWKDGRGMVFTTLNLAASWAQANAANNYDPAWDAQKHAWRVCAIDSAGWPVECP